MLFLFLDFVHKGKVDNAILSLQESGELETLRKTWWEIKAKDGGCNVSNKLFYWLIISQEHSAPD